MPVVPRITLAAALVWIGALACVVGLLGGQLWAVLPWARLGDSLVLVAVSLLLAGAVHRWRGWPIASALALVWLIALAFFAGVPALFAVLLLAAAALALGSLVVPRDGARVALALPVGLVLIGGCVGWTLRWPIHHAYLYLPLLLGLCIVRRHVLRDAFEQIRRGWQDAVVSAPRLAAVAVLALGLASLGSWLPTMQADDLAYHLALPSQLLQHARYAPDPNLQIWALAPWLGDVLQGVAQVLAGREARGALDALWMLVAATALWQVSTRLGATARSAWLGVALFGSLPMLAALSAGMQTELPAAALLVALALAVLRSPEDDMLYAGAILVAGLAGLKLGSAFAALMMLIWALVRARGRIAWSRVPIALLLLCVLAGSSYALAWRLSGNPLLPLFNDVFRSPVLPPEQLSDPRWHAGIGFALPWSMTFDTDRYLEAWDGGFGFVLVALAGAWLLALVRRETRGIALAASAVLLLPLLPMQYARYAFPGLVLLLPALLVATEHALAARWAMRLVLALCALNLAFQANANWLLHVNTVRKLVTSAGRIDGVYLRYAPERALIAELRRRDDGDSIVLAIDAQTPTVAELAGRGRTVAHYAPALAARRIAADADASGALWQRLIRDLDARWLLLRPERLGAAQRAAIASLGATRVASVGEAELWSVAAPGVSP
jgi:hypothetical protein